MILGPIGQVNLEFYNLFPKTRDLVLFLQLLRCYSNCIKKFKNFKSSNLLNCRTSQNLKLCFLKRAHRWTLLTGRILPKVRVQGVKSLCGHIACLCREFNFYELKKIIYVYYYFSKRKGKYFYTCNNFYSEKSSIRAK